MQQDEVFLGFLESIDENLTRATVDGPDDQPLPSSGALRTPFVRLRLGAISQSDFLVMMDRVTPLLSPSRDIAARNRRLNELREALHPEQLPLTDIHLPPWAALSEEVLEIAQLGGWYQFRVELHRRDRRLAPVFFAYPDNEVVRQEFLVSFGLPSSDMAERLRDIFSLAHVGDWGTDDDLGGVPVLPPIQPFDGERMQLITIPYSSKRSVMEAEGLVLEEYAASSQLQYVTVTE
jgi:hypothetical protein